VVHSHRRTPGMWTDWLQGKAIWTAITPSLPTSQRERCWVGCCGCTYVKWCEVRPGFVKHASTGSLQEDYRASGRALALSQTAYPLDATSCRKAPPLDPHAPDLSVLELLKLEPQ
jgi:hypothetical protein